MNCNTIAKSFAIAAAAAIFLGTAPAALADNKGCTNTSLKGTFVFKGSGFITAPPALAGPFAHVGTLVFDGNGGLKGAGLGNLNGTIIPGTDVGSYAVSSDCTGTFTFQESPSGLTVHAYFIIDSNFKELQIMETDAGTVATGVARRQFPAGDSRD